MIVLALTIGGLTIYGDESYSRYTTLQRSLKLQEQKNQELDQHVRGLRKRVNGLTNDPRELEKAARNELGMARPDELIFIFDKGDDEAGR